MNLDDYYERNEGFLSITITDEYGNIYKIGN